MINDSAAPLADDAEIFGKLLPAKTAFPPPDMALTIAIVMAGRRWRAVIDEKLRTLGQSASRMEALASIAYAPPQTTQIQIAKRIGIEGPTLTRTLDMLEADGLVVRQPDPSDRRNKLMKLTPSGYAVLAKMLNVTQSLRSELLGDIPADESSAAHRFVSTLLDRIEGGLGQERE